MQQRKAQWVVPNTVAQEDVLLVAQVHVTMGVTTTVGRHARVVKVPAQERAAPHAVAHVAIQAEDSKGQEGRTGFLPSI